MISWFEKHNKLSLLITIIIAGIIFYMSSQIFEQGIGSGGIGFKALAYHLIAFFSLAFFLSVSLVRGEHKKFISIAIILSILYGISDEIHQFFVPGRVSSIYDIFLNSFGIILASTLYLISLEYRTRKHYSPSL